MVWSPHTRRKVNNNYLEQVQCRATRFILGRDYSEQGGLATAFDLGAFRLSMIAPVKKSVNHSRTVASMRETGWEQQQKQVCPAIRQWEVNGGGGALRYFLGGYVPPGTLNWHPVLKKFPLKLIPHSRNGPIFYTLF